MIKIPRDFDGQKFMDKFGVGMYDFWVNEKGLVCPSLPNLKQKDIADCVTDWEKYAEAHPNKNIPAPKIDPSEKDALQDG